MVGYPGAGRGTPHIVRYPACRNADLPRKAYWSIGSTFRHLLGAKSHAAAKTADCAPVGSPPDVMRSRRRLRSSACAMAGGGRGAAGCPRRAPTPHAPSTPPASMRPSPARSYTHSPGASPARHHFRLTGGQTSCVAYRLPYRHPIDGRDVRRGPLRNYSAATTVAG